MYGYSFQPCTNAGTIFYPNDKHKKSLTLSNKSHKRSNVKKRSKHNSGLPLFINIAVSRYCERL